MMLLVESLAPPVFFGASTATFLVAIQSSQKGRVYLAPLLFGTAILSLHTSFYLEWLVGMNVLWALLICVWILHATAVLYIDRISLPKSEPPWIWAYRAWCDPQRQIDWKGFPPRTLSSQKSSRVGSIFRRLLRVVVCWVLQLFIVGPLVPLYFGFHAQDFTPSRQVFIRRLLSSSFGPPITSREIQIRCFISVYWIWIAFLMLDVCNVLLSILFFGILRLDAPEDWRPLFGSPLQAYSIRRFWTKFWHKLTAPSCASSGRWINRELLGMAPGSRNEKTFIAFWTFFLSGICHAVSDWQGGELGMPMDDVYFFVANFVAGAVETVVVQLANRALKNNGHDRLQQILWSDAGRRIIGFVWVLGFFFWITPKWQFPKLHAVLQQVEHPGYGEK
ncbi:MAG: hypothetical protein M4579_004492 [Chaenotheca gracillima]|nr:MAG: hypothetical protein M4579_004492 [Chaenotheca gracillima]